MVRRLLPYALFLILVCIFLWRPIFTGRAFLPGDYLAQMQPWKSVIKPSPDAPQWNPLQWDAIAQYYPWRVFYARSMRQGHIPLWNPHQFCGTPFLANGQSAVLYPLNLVFLIFDPITALTVYAALHLFLAAAFMYLLLRELGCGELGGIVGGITFAFSAFMVLWLELLTFPGAAIWLPLALLLIHRAVERRSLFYGMLSGLILAMSFLAGHFQIAFYVLFAAMLWWLWELIEVIRREGQVYAVLRVVVPFIGCMAILALIAAPQVLPTIELARNSPRSGVPTAAGYNWFIANSLKPYRLITALAPDLYGNPSRRDYCLLGVFHGHAASAADYMEYGMYCGILPLMLALVALFGIKRKRYVGFFALLGGLALLCALGTPINSLFYWLIPGISSLGGPNRILLLYCFGVAAMAGAGTDILSAGPTQRAPRDGWRLRVDWPRFALPVLSLMILGLALAVLTWFAVPRVRDDLLWVMVGTEERARIMATRLWFAASVVLFAGTTRLVRGRVLAYAAVGLIIADLFAFGMNYNPTCERGKVYPDTPLTKKLQAIAKDSRIAPINTHWSLYQTPDAILPPNAAMVYGLYDVQGYDSLYPRAYKGLLYRIEGVDPSPPECGNMVLVKRYTPAVLDIGNIILSRTEITGLSKVGTYDGVAVYHGPTDGVSVVSGRGAGESYSFRFGLYLMCLGVAALVCVGVYRAVKFRKPGR